MTVLMGLSETHNASCCLVDDGKIIACASEERFTRKKNQEGFPKNAIKWCLTQTNKPIDKVCLHFENFYWGSTQEFSSDMPESRKLYRNITGLIEYYTPFLSFGYKIPQSIITPFIFKKWNEEHLDFVSKELDLHQDDILTFPHEHTHIATAQYGNNLPKKEPYLIFTLDGAGDKYCGTVSKVEDGWKTILAKTDNKDSIGILWHYATKYMGMKPCEHEYKIMGLAPYAKVEHGEKVYDIMKKIIKVKGLKWEATKHKLAFPYFLRDKLYQLRFDNIAYGLQVLTERLICEWVRNAIKQTGIHNIALAGGVFQNIKANMEISKMSEVENMFVFPSPGDESTAIGACYSGFEYLDEANKLKPIKDIYFGPEFSDEEIINTFTREGIPTSKYEVTKENNIEKVSAELLSEDKIVGRFNGRMEFGARALGNRTIMANPSNINNVRKLNETIKARDWWMPFCGSLLKEDEEKYLINPKNISAPYMVLGFETTEIAQEQIPSTLHQGDFTSRPQVLERGWNDNYYKIISEFKKLTGIGCILNTSLNIHGSPIVCSPKDGIEVMENSKLKYIVMGKYLVVKK